MTSRNILINLSGTLSELPIGDTPNIPPTVLIGTITVAATPYIPVGWLPCDGGTQSISEYPNLFAAIGTTFGGNGTTTFGIPDLRCRVPVGVGSSSGLASITLGELGGANSVTVNSTGTAEVDIAEANLPAHTHTATTHVKVGVNIVGTTTATPGMAGLASTASGGATAASVYALAGADLGTTYDLGNVTTDIDNTGSGETLDVPVTTEGSANVMQPYLGLHYIIAYLGVQPQAPILYP